MLPDFLIGAQASLEKSPLLTNNKGDFVGYFPDITIICRKKVSKRGVGEGAKRRYPRLAIRTRKHGLRGARRALRWIRVRHAEVLLLAGEIAEGLFDRNHRAGDGPSPGGSLRSPPSSPVKGPVKGEGKGARIDRNVTEYRIRIHRRDAVLPLIARGAGHQIDRAGVEPERGAVPTAFRTRRRACCAASVGWANLTASQVLSPVCFGIGSAAGTPRDGSDERVDQASRAWLRSSLGRGVRAARAEPRGR